MKTDLNFYVSYRMTNRHLAMKSKPSYLITALIIITIALIGGVTLFLIVLNITDGMRISQLKEEKAGYTLDLKEYERLNNELAEAKKKETSISNVIANIQSHRMVKSNELTAIYAVLPADVSVISANYMKSTLSLECECTNKDSPSLSAENLSKQGIPSVVTYTGFDTQKADADVKVKFTIVCLLGEAE
jgi:hypothetical protein